MLVRLIDYVGSEGGGVRFAVELLRALVGRTSARFEILSHGAALDRYRSLLGGVESVTFADVPPRNLGRRHTFLAGVPGAGPLNWLLGTANFHYEPPHEALESCDVVWFPWAQQHRVPERSSARVVASLHDVILIDFPGVANSSQRENERETVRRWLLSEARVVVSSRATVAALTRLYGGAAERAHVIRVAAKHARRGPGIPEDRGWSFRGAPYLLCPANPSVHKNHETLLAGVGAWGSRWPLVLTGTGTNLWEPGGPPRRAALRAAAVAAGLVRDRTLFTLGYVDDPTYYNLLEGAAALVMPTLAEGGGSFPVMEALAHGIPVLSSDIPVMREMAEEMAAEMIWFAARDPADLAAKLEQLHDRHADIKASAIEQASRLQLRSWEDVADEYARALDLPSVDPRSTSQTKIAGAD